MENKVHCYNFLWYIDDIFKILLKILCEDVAYLIIKKLLELYSEQMKFNPDFSKNYYTIVLNKSKTIKSFGLAMGGMRSRSEFEEISSYGVFIRKVIQGTALAEAEKRYDLKLEGFEIICVNNSEYTHYFDRNIQEIKTNLKRDLKKQKNKIVLLLRWNQRLLNRYNFRYTE